MERDEALARLNKLKGKDLRALADRVGITVWTPSVAVTEVVGPNCRLNKGWAGQAIERYLELPLNSSRSPNGGSWELKLVPLKRRRDGSLQVKETMAITMLDPVEVLAKPFKESHLYAKLKRTLVAARIYENSSETTSLLYSVAAFDLGDAIIFEKVSADYEEVRRAIRAGGVDSLSGKMGELVQPRTKGPGHGSVSRAFYARTKFVGHIIGLGEIV
jgi:DNA mismatch repair protein MutH